MSQPLEIKARTRTTVWTGRVSRDGFGTFVVNLRKGKTQSLGPDALSCRWDTEWQAASFLMEEIRTRVSWEMDKAEEDPNE